jgi:predicted MFS family arabinose efflux permease
MSPSIENTKLSKGLLFIMTTAVFATIANLNYNQPLLPFMGKTLAVDAGSLGWIPFASQLGYAVAILLISPLGDRTDRRGLIRNLSCTLVLGLLITYFASSFWMLVVATFFVGLSANITQQILPFAASLVTDECRGAVISTLMTGLTAGILVSRALSGIIAEHLGWRAVFLFAAVVAAVIGVLLQCFLPRSQPTASLSYPKLLGSMFTMVKTQPLLREASITGALWFAAFNALWATLAIHVTSEPFNYSVQQAGLFGFVGMAGLVGAKASGLWVNRFGARFLITAGLMLVLLGFGVLVLCGDHLAGLILGILLLDIGVFGSQIPNQVRIFSIDPKAQSRLNAVYMLFYFVGASLGSVLGVKVMGEAGWLGLSFFGLSLALLALIYHLLQGRRPCRRWGASNSL